MAPEAGEAATPDFAAQCEAMLEADPRIISSIMGLYPEEFVAKMKARGIAWWATATTVAEARAAVAAGADVIVAQGAEAGGHRGAFNAAEAESRQVGLACPSLLTSPATRRPPPKCGLFAYGLRVHC